jgi:DNA topoisomerase-2
MSNTQELADKYQKKTDREHVLDNPDTYIGSVEEVQLEYFIFNNETNKIVKKPINMIPGLYKLFDEAIVNARDHVVRMQQIISNDRLEKLNQETTSTSNTEKVKKSQINLPVTTIDITIDEKGMITICNDGNGVDVRIHPQYNIWIPELIFGHLRTSTNYDKQEKKIVGGKNGFGFKLALIWSTWGKVETVDHKTGQKYCQEFTDNLSVIKPPVITRQSGKPYTKISFIPDYDRLKLKGLSSDFISLFKKRVYDIAAVTDKSIRVKFNGEQLTVKTFQHYVDYYIGDKKEYERVIESPNERWEYTVALSNNDEFQQISFVNGIATTKGGRHVDYIVNQIIKKMIQYIKDKKKIDVKPASIREQLILFLDCTIENPAFDSQSKEYLTTNVSNFGSVCEVSDKFVEKLAKMGVMTAACNITEVKDNKAVKKTDGTKSKSIRGIPKLIDANFAGTNRSNKCMLILCEGDSAKSGIVSGLSRQDRDLIGVYPLKGKLLNIRGEPITRISDNREITELKQVIGLEHGCKYTRQSVDEKLRYGKVIFMTDQDLDGSHIKGLCINMFDSEWQSLLEIPEFLGYMNTPILKVSKGKDVKNFYNDGEFQNWRETNDTKGWNIKYYKGLGTSTGKEFKEYFMDKKIVDFSTTPDTGEVIDKIFNKKRSNDRKEWLASYDRKRFLDTNKTSITYEEFINNDLIHFSKYDNDRSIPNIMDGLKISQRKILYSAFKKRLDKEIKVAQFSGYVSEHSGYHHGEASLNSAIIGLAQTFVGSNNINLFMPNGSFGTRLVGGKDSASERYIFTQLSKITRQIFSEVDDNIIEYLDDDGDLVEPVYYTPIIPMILVNGAKGIGTGFSTDIMCYNPLDIIKYITNKLNNVSSSSVEVLPYYRGFKGKILAIDNSNKKFLIKGLYVLKGKDKIVVTELPIGTWTQDYKEFLESLVVKKQKANEVCYVKDYIDMSTDNNVEFEITFYPNIINKLLQDKYDSGIDGVEKYLKLTTTQSTTNMNLFNNKEQLKKYENVYDIIDEYYSIRYEYYNKRREYLIDIIKKQLTILSNKARYIQMILADELDLRKKSKLEIDTMLESNNFERHTTSNDYNYLIKMPMDSVSSDNVERLLNEHASKKQELYNIETTTSSEIWLKELVILETSINNLYK